MYPHHCALCRDVLEAHPKRNLPIVIEEILLLPPVGCRPGVVFREQEDLHFLDVIIRETRK